MPLYDDLRGKLVAPVARGQEPFSEEDPFLRSAGLVDVRGFRVIVPVFGHGLIDGVPRRDLRGGRYRIDLLCKIRNARRFHHVPESYPYRELFPYQHNQFHTEQGISSEAQEIILPPHPGQSQQGSVYGRQFLFRGGLRIFV